MSQRMAMILALALTLVLGTGVYAARGRVIGPQTTQSQQEVVVPTTEVVVSEDVIGRQNPPAVQTSDSPDTGLDESSSASNSAKYAEDEDSEHDGTAKTNPVRSDNREVRNSDHEEDDDD